MEEGAAFVLNPASDPSTQIKVPVVQELASSLHKNSTAIPQIYIRPDDEKPDITETSDIKELPIIDMAVIFSQDNQDRQTELNKLSKACEDWGFFQMVNHGLPLENMKRECEGFFGLSLEERMRCKQSGDDLQGYGQGFVSSQNQTFDWADFLYLSLCPVHQRSLHVWNGLPQKMRETLERYGKEMEKLILRVIGLFEENLGLRGGSLLGQCKEWTESMRINCYPPCPRPDLALGLSPHSDASLITVLMETGQAPGLQIKKGKEWILIKPLADALVVNIGDYMEIITNGRYKSIEHRAVTNRDTSRISAATFYIPGPNESVEPAIELVNSIKSTMYRKVSHREYFTSYISKRLEGKKGLNGYFSNAGISITPASVIDSLLVLVFQEISSLIDNRVVYI